MRMANILKVDASLSDGKLLSEKTERILFGIMALSVVLSTLYLFGLQYLHGTARIVIMCFSWVPIAMLLGAFLRSNANSKLKQNIQLCLKDAVEVEAKITKQSHEGKFRLEVEFEYNGEMQKRYSKPYKSGVFCAHEDKTEIVYYSPSCDKVLLLKNER